MRQSRKRRPNRSYLLFDICLGHTHPRHDLRIGFLDDSTEGGVGAEHSGRIFMDKEEEAKVYEPEI